MTAIDDLIPVAHALLRLIVGAFMIPHGMRKLGYWGGSREFETKLFHDMGLKPGNVWRVIASLLQLIPGMLLVFGLFTRPAALLTSLFMLVAALIGVRRNGWYWQNHGMEFAIFWTLAAFAVALQGPGAWALDNIF